MWRPDNWDTDKLVNEFDETKPATEFDYFEAGADAMLEALKRCGEYYSSGEWDFQVPDKGWVIFIPDEGVKDGS